MGITLKLLYLYITLFSREILLDQDDFQLHFLYHSVAMLFFFKILFKWRQSEKN